MTTTPIRPSSPSRFLAGEIRAEMARQGLSQRDLAERLGFTHPWVTRRIGRNAVTDFTLEDLVKVSEALGVKAEDLVSLVLPRLDSNQQPSGYLFPLVSGRDDLELVA